MPGQRKEAKKDAPQNGQQVSTEEAERLAEDRGTAPEEEVKAEEFTRGIADPVGTSPLPHDLVEELRKPLDPDRVRRRQGSGGRQLEYLAGHDVKRRANELFGFGNWSYRVVELANLNVIEVQNNNGNEGAYVGYRSVVEVTVKTLDGPVTFSDVGYGDGVEYTGPKAVITASELAIKEAVTDGLKRALTGWGDQFGLILYAKADEKQRIVRDQDKTQVRDAPAVPVPRNWAESVSMFATLLGAANGEREKAEAIEWLREAVKALYNVDARSDLSRNDHVAAGQRFASTVLLLWEKSNGDLTFRQGKDLRELIAEAFAERWDGIALSGPAWRLGPDEADRPAWEEAKTTVLT